MKVKLKDFRPDLEIKNKGIEFAIYSPNGKEYKGDLIPAECLY